MFRIRRNGQEPVVDADQVGENQPAIRSIRAWRDVIGDRGRSLTVGSRFSPLGIRNQMEGSLGGAPA